MPKEAASATSGGRTHHPFRSIAAVVCKKEEPDLSLCQEYVHPSHRSSGRYLGHQDSSISVKSLVSAQESSAGSRRDAPLDKKPLASHGKVHYDPDSTRKTSSPLTQPRRDAPLDKKPLASHGKVHYDPDSTRHTNSPLTQSRRDAALDKRPLASHGKRQYDPDSTRQANSPLSQPLTHGLKSMTDTCQNVPNALDEISRNPWLQSSEIPSLFELCVLTVLDNIDGLGVVGDVPDHLFMRILDHCDARKLDEIQVLNPSVSSEVAAHMDKCWRRICHLQLHLETDSTSILSQYRVRTWRGLYRAVLKEQDLKRVESSKKLRDMYGKIAQEKKSRTVQPVGILVRNKKSRGILGGGAVNVPLDPRAAFKGNLMRKSLNDLKASAGMVAARKGLIAGSLKSSVSPRQPALPLAKRVKY